MSLDSLLAYTIFYDERPYGLLSVRSNHLLSTHLLVAGNKFELNQNEINSGREVS